MCRSSFPNTASTWWRNQMETFSAIAGHLCGEFTGSRWIPAQRPVMRSFDVFFYLRLNKRLSKHLWGWWCGTLSCPLWRHCNVKVILCWSLHTFRWVIWVFIPITWVQIPWGLDPRVYLVWEITTTAQIEATLKSKSFLINTSARVALVSRTPGQL